jgi:hypothetical protein
MKVTDLNYFMEPKLVEKLDLMIDRTTKGKMDNVVIVDGHEGYGKTNISAGVAYYVHWKTKRPLSLVNFFFDVEKLIDFALKTEQQIIIWDEAALQGLAAQWQNRYQIKLVKLLMVARKKRHFFIFNIPKFYKLNEYIAVDRSIGLIHVYARRETQLGRFTYYNKKTKEILYLDWRSKRKRNYSKYYNFHGSFPEVLGKIVDEKAYDAKKDEGIASLGENDKTPIYSDKLLKLQYGLTLLPDALGIKVKDLLEVLDVSKNAFHKWKEIPQKYPHLLRKLALKSQNRKDSI